MKFVCEVCTEVTETSNYRGWLMHLSTSTHQRTLKFNVNPRFGNVDPQNTYVLTGFTKPLSPHGRLLLLEYMSKYGMIVEYFHDIKYLFCYFTFVSGSGASEILKEREYGGTEILVRVKSKLSRQDWDGIYDSARKLSQSGEDISSNSNKGRSSGESTTSGRGGRVFTPRPSRGRARGGTSGSGHVGGKSNSSSRSDLTKESSDAGMKVSSEPFSHPFKTKNVEVSGKRGHPLQHKGEGSRNQATKPPANQKDIQAAQGIPSITSSSLTVDTPAEIGVKQLSGRLPNTDMANPWQSSPAVTGEPLALDGNEANTCQIETVPPNSEVPQSVHQDQTATPDEDKVLDTTTEDMEAREEEAGLNHEAEPAVEEPKSKAEQLPADHCTEILDGEKDQVNNDDGKAAPPVTSCDTEKEKLAVTNVAVTTVQNEPTTAEDHEKECHHNDPGDANSDAKEIEVDPVHDESNKLDITQIGHNTGTPDEIVSNTSIKQDSGELPITDTANPCQSSPSPSANNEPLVVGANEASTCQIETVAANPEPEVTQSVNETLAVTPDEDQVSETKEVTDALEDEAGLNLEADELSSEADLEQLSADDCSESTQILDGETNKDQVYNDDGQRASVSTSCVTEKETLTVPNVVTTTFQSELITSETEGQEDKYHHNDSADVKRDAKEIEGDPIHVESNKLDITQIGQNTDVPDEIDGIFGAKQLLITDEGSPCEPTPASDVEPQISSEVENKCQHNDSSDVKRDEEEHGGGGPHLHEQCNKLEFTPIDRSASFIPRSNDISDEIVGETGVKQLSSEFPNTDVAIEVQPTPSTGHPFGLVTTEEGKACQSEDSAAAAIPEVTQSVHETAVTSDEEEDKFLQTTEEDMEAHEEEAEVNLEADVPSSNADLEQRPGDNCTQILDGEKDQGCNDDGKPVPLSTSCVAEEEKLVVTNVGIAPFDIVTKAEDQETGYHHPNYSAYIKQLEKKEDEDYPAPVGGESNKSTIEQIDENTWFITSGTGKIQVKF